MLNLKGDPELSLLPFPLQRLEWGTWHGAALSIRRGKGPGDDDGGEGGSQSKMGSRAAAPAPTVPSVLCQGEINDLI